MTKNGIFRVFEKQRFWACQSALKRDTQDLEKDQTSSNFKHKKCENCEIFDRRARAKKGKKGSQGTTIFRAQFGPDSSLIFLRKRQKNVEKSSKMGENQNDGEL